MIKNEIQRSSLLLEIGTEDIPARFLPSAILQLKENTETIFKENHIRFSEVKTLGSPRRLAVIANGILPMQEDRIKEIFGPSKKQLLMRTAGIQRRQQDLPVLKA